MTEFEATLDNGLCRVNVTGFSVVTLCKLYGPLSMCDIRVRIDLEECQWVVEKAEIPQDDNGNDLDKVWIEVTRINGQ